MKIVPLRCGSDCISDVERADVSVLDDVISVGDGYKQCDLSIDEILLTIYIMCTNWKPL